MNTQPRSRDLTPTARRVLWAFAPLALVAVIACGDGSGESEATATEAVLVQVAEYGPAPGSFSDAAKQSDAVVYGTVVAVKPGRLLDGPADEPTTQIADVVLEVAEVLAGDTDSKQVVIEMLGWETGSDGTQRPILTEGVPVPDVGEEMVWFLEREQGKLNQAARYGLISLDGILRVDEGVLRSKLTDGDRLGPRSNGITLEELTRELRGR